MRVQEERPPIAVHEAWLPAEHPLHRPRHGGRQRTALLSALVFFVVPVLALLLGVRPAEFENRRLAEFPSPLSGWSFFATLPAWAADHLPLRDAAVRAAEGLSRGVFGEPSSLGISDGPDNQDGSVGPVIPVAPPADTRRPATSPTIPGVFPNMIEGDDGWLYFGFDVEAKCAPARPLEETIAAVNRLRAVVQASGRQFVLVVPPDKTTAQPEYLPDDYPGRGCLEAATPGFWQQVTSRAGAVDLRDDLQTLATPRWPVYHRLDSHWTDRGALAMVTTLAEQVERGSTREWYITPAGTTRTRADLPELIGRSGMNSFVQYSLAPSGSRDRTGPYVDDLSTPVHLGRGAAPGVVSKPVFLLADSFSESAARYLAAGFSDVVMVDYGATAGDAGRTAGLMADQEVVVLEVVERNLSSGHVPVLEPAVLDVITPELAARPFS